MSKCVFSFHETRFKAPGFDRKDSTNFLQFIGPCNRVSVVRIYSKEKEKNPLQEEMHIVTDQYNAVVILVFHAIRDILEYSKV